MQNLTFGTLWAIFKPPASALTYSQFNSTRFPSRGMWLSGCKDRVRQRCSRVGKPFDKGKEVTVNQKMKNQYNCCWNHWKLLLCYWFPPNFLLPLQRPLEKVERERPYQKYAHILKGCCQGLWTENMHQSQCYAHAVCVNIWKPFCRVLTHSLQKEDASAWSAITTGHPRPVFTWALQMTLLT